MGQFKTKKSGKFLRIEVRQHKLDGPYGRLALTTADLLLCTLYFFTEQQKNEGDVSIMVKEAEKIIRLNADLLSFYRRRPVLY